MQSRVEASEPLLSHKNSDTNVSIPESGPLTNPAKRHYPTLAAQGILGVLGLGAGALYIGPATYCATSSDAGIWLSLLVSEKVAIGIFTAGGADYASINAYFSSKSVQSFYDYIKKQKTTSAKITKGGLIMLYTATQELSLLLTSSVTSTSPLETIVTVTGGAPGILYAGVGMMDNELPHLISNIKALSTKLRNGIVDRFYSLTPTEQLYRQQVKHYQKQYQLFLNHLEENWHYVATHASTLPIKSEASALDQLFNADIHGQPMSFWQRAVHLLGNFMGVALTVNYSAAFTMNTLTTLVPFVPSLPLQILLTAILSSSSTYGNLKIGMHGMTGLLDNIANLLSGKPVDSLAFQLRPKTSAAVAAGLIPASALSYAVSDFLFLKEFPGKNAGLRRILRYSANASMSFYHLAGLFHFYTLILSLTTKDKHEQAVFALEHEVEKLKKMTLEEFVEFTEKNSPEENARYGISVAEAKPAPSVPIEPQQPAVSQSKSWFSWFKRKAPEQHPLLAQESVHEIVEDGFVLIR